MQFQMQACQRRVSRPSSMQQVLQMRWRVMMDHLCPAKISKSGALWCPPSKDSWPHCWKAQLLVCWIVTPSFCTYAFKITIAEPMTLHYHVHFQMLTMLGSSGVLLGMVGRQVPSLVVPPDTNPKVVVLRREHAWHLAGALQQHEAVMWVLTYHSSTHGLSFNTFLGNVA